jgi:hypothetical protein
MYLEKPLSTTEAAEPLTEHWTRSTLRRYQELDQRADHVAAIVYATRFKGSKADYFKHEYDFGTGYGEYVQSSYYWHNEPDYIQWPLDFLWADDETIVQRTLAQIEDEKRKTEEKQRAAWAEHERQERARYEELKAKFEQPHANAS